MALKFPKQITAGDSLDFTDSVADYAASDGWVLSYALSDGTNQYSIGSTAAGDEHQVVEAAADTAEWSAGNYRWQAYVSKDAQRFTVGRGFVEILADILNSADDPRHHVERTLLALEAMLEGKATKDQESLSLNGRSLTRMKVEDLLVWRDKYRAELRQIRAADRVSQGLASGRKIMVRF